MPTDQTQHADALFEPRSIAVIGASTDSARIGGRPIFYTRRGFQGPIYPVNPNQAEVQGLKSHASITAIPGDVDLALIALPAHAVPDAVDACIAKGVRAIAMFSSGFAETGDAGRVAQEHLRERCATAGVRLLGPNCLGVLNPAHGLMLTFSTALESAWPQPGPVSVVSQSGAVGIYAMSIAVERGVGIARWLSTGNEADIDVAQCLEWYADDERTRVVMVYFEGCRDPQRLAAAMQRCARRSKPVIVLKSGRSEAGKRAVAAHTASDAGSDDMYEALFRDAGAYRVDSMEQQIDMAYACANGVLPRGPRLGIISISGGINVLTADAAIRHGLELPAMPAAAQAEVKALIPFASPPNPVDTTAQVINDPALFARILDILLEQRSTDSVIIYLQTLARAASRFGPYRECLLQARQRHPQVLFVLTGGYPEDMRAELEGRGFLIFEDPERSVRAVAGLAALRQRLQAHA